MRNGIRIAVGEAGWRQVWIAYAADGRIAGHVDLRARIERVSKHRALLGMGVQRDFRRQGLGAQLVAAAYEWAKGHGIDWIDLDVLSVNRAAIELYLRCGFTVVGELRDMFRIDGESLGHTLMTREVL
jgi:ribosomal protein S18 acetylase RimI-like enzyme